MAGLAKTAMRLALGPRLPTTSGELVVHGLSEPTTIKRDRFGVPHIFATTDHDAWYALGFCHGQDRAFQLEILGRVARGTLAELVGEPALGVDRLSRRMGFWKSGKRRLAVVDGWVRRAIESYAAGVNEGRRRGLGRPPHEFALLRAKPTPFLAEDALAVLTLEAFFLSSNWDTELARLLVVMADGAEALEDLDPAYPHWHAVSVPPGGSAGTSIDALRRDLDSLAGWAGMTGASNAWAVAPSKTAIGRTLLANDPHLAPLMPPHWYLCHLETPEWRLAGASFVGGPGLPAGHNGHAAWGVTAGLADVTDLYLEEFADDGRHVRGPNGFEPCDVRTEVIGVRGEDPVAIDVVTTKRGPIIGPALAGGVDAISIKATWLSDRPVQGFLGMHNVGSFEDFRQRVVPLAGASFGMVYADVNGHIGYALTGEVPSRLHGDGTIPLPGWEAGQGWADNPVPVNDLPHVIDPEEAYVATANNKPSADDEPWLGVDFIDGYRIGRISEVLANRDDWDVPQTMSFQLDVQSVPWREVRDSVLTALAGDPALEDARLLLEAWDGRIAATSRAAALFELAMTELHHRVVAAKAPHAAEWVIGRGFNTALPYNLLGVRAAGRISGLLERRPEGWFADGWDQAISESVKVADRALRTRGDRPTWGELRPLVLRHPLAQRPAVASVFNLGPIPWQGDANTVSQAGPDPFQPAQPVTLAIASMRMTVDVGRWDRCRFVLPGGQSGNPLSRHYSDQLPLWLRGDGIPIPIDPAEVDEITHHSLTLVPALSS